VDVGSAAPLVVTVENTTGVAEAACIDAAHDRTALFAGGPV
jgi:hypothetical protein